MNITTGNFLFIFLLGLGLFLLIRGIVIWYFKINKIIQLLEDIKDNTGGEVVDTSHDRGLN